MRERDECLLDRTVIISHFIKTHTSGRKSPHCCTNLSRPPQRSHEIQERVYIANYTFNYVCVSVWFGMFCTCTINSWCSAINGFLNGASYSASAFYQSYLLTYSCLHFLSTDFRTELLNDISCVNMNHSLGPRPTQLLHDYSRCLWPTSKSSLSGFAILVSFIQEHQR